MLLLFGKDDPWCTPAFAKRMYQSLKTRNVINSKEDSKQPIQRYVELDNVGHCPNHEAPHAVGAIASVWTSSPNRNKEKLDLLECLNVDSNGFNEDWGNVSAREIGCNEAGLSLMERIITSLV